MRYKSEKKHYILKALVILTVLFFAAVAFMDGTPPVQTIEKEVINGANQN